MNSKVLIPIVILLVIASFLVGTAWTKIGFLGNKIAQVSPSPAQEQTQTPAEPVVLGASTMNELVKGGVVLGASDAKVTVVEFSDPSCPFCAAADGADIVVSQDESGKDVRIISDYLKKNDPTWLAPGPELEKLAREGKIQLVFRYYPGHGTGEKAMQAAWCVAEQNSDKFWTFMDLAYNNKDKIETTEGLLSLVEQTGGLDQEKVKVCLESGKYQQRIQTDIQVAKEAVKAATGKEDFGTPTFFVNGYQVVGAQPYKNFEQLINQELAK